MMTKSEALYESLADQQREALKEFGKSFWALRDSPSFHVMLEEVMSLLKDTDEEV